MLKSATRGLQANLPPGVALGQVSIIGQQGVILCQVAEISHQRWSWAKLTKLDTRAPPITFCSNQPPGALPQQKAQIGHGGTSRGSYAQNQLAGYAPGLSCQIGHQAIRGCSCDKLPIWVIPGHVTPIGHQGTPHNLIPKLATKGKGTLIGQVA